MLSYNKDNNHATLRNNEYLLLNNIESHFKCRIYYLFEKDEIPDIDVETLETILNKKELKKINSKKLKNILKKYNNEIVSILGENLFYDYVRYNIQSYKFKHFFEKNEEYYKLKENTIELEKKIKYNLTLDERYAFVFDIALKTYNYHKFLEIYYGLKNNAHIEKLKESLKEFTETYKIYRNINIPVDYDCIKDKEYYVKELEFSKTLIKLKGNSLLRRFQSKMHSLLRRTKLKNVWYNFFVENVDLYYDFFHLKTLFNEMEPKMTNISKFMILDEILKWLPRERLPRIIREDLHSFFLKIIDIKEKLEKENKFYPSMKRHYEKLIKEYFDRSGYISKFSKDTFKHILSRK